MISFKRFPLVLLFVALPWALHAEELTVDERLQTVMMTQLDLTGCGDTAYTFENDEQSAEKYNELSFRLLDEAKAKGWTPDEIALASVLVMENRTDLVVKEDDTLEEFRLRNYTGERCDRQVAAAQEYLAGSFPMPE